MNKLKLNFVFTHPIQYKTPLMKEISNNMNVLVHFMSKRGVEKYFDKDFGKSIKWDVDLLDGYKYKFHKNKTKHFEDKKKFYSFCNPNLINSIRESSKNDIWIIHGWNYISCWLVVLSCMIFGKKYIVSAETPYLHERKKNIFSRTLRKIIIGNFFLKFSYKIFYIGKANRAFFENQGVIDSKLIYYPYCVDNNLFQSKAKEITAKEKSNLLIQHSLVGKKIILVCGKLNHKKRAMGILKSFALSSLEKKDWALLFVGDGPLKEKLLSEVENYNCKVIVTGFINQKEIPLYYSISTIYLMASGIGETWGLATNEAMNFSKPIMISNYSGCSHDLVIDGYNGFEFITDDIKSLTNKLNKLNDITVSELNLMGQRSKDIIENFNFKKVSDNIQEHIFYG